MTTSLNKTDSNTSPKYFDVWIDVIHGEHRVKQPNRVKADNADEAITKAFVNNVRNLSEEDVSDILFRQTRELYNAYATVDDVDCVYSLDFVIEVKPMTVKSNGKELTVFVPSHDKDLTLYDKYYAHGMVGR